MIRRSHRAGSAGRVVRPLLISLAALVLWGSGPMWACDMPVYQFTLANWERDPYRAYYLYGGKPDAADAKVNDLLRQASEGLTGHANLSFVAVDTTARDTDRAPDVELVLARYMPDKLPAHVVLSPRARPIFSGRLNQAEVKALLACRGAAELSKLLSEGKQGCLVLMLSGDEETDKGARDVVRQTLAKAGESEYDVGLVEVNRKAPADRWITRQLLAVEEDLAQLPAPMVFGAFGRGHVTEAFLSKGINESNLLQLIEFMNGPCTCEIKEAAIGVDLLTNWDWAKYVNPEHQTIRSMEPGGFVTLDDE